MITCFIRYEIDPYKRDAFTTYARNWGQVIPRCGADLIGYFAPHEGSATTAYGVYTVDSLAAYEAYRARLKDDALGRENYAFSQKERFIVREDRLFLRLASAPACRAGFAVIAVIFEVWPAAGQQGHYLDLAAALRPELAQVDGFLSVERFESLTSPGKLLSVSFWRDEAAVAAWRNTAAHRLAQAKGRDGVFSNYRLRIAAVLRDYGMAERDGAPDDSRIAHDGG